MLIRASLLSTSGSVDGAARLAASARGRVARCFGLLAQTGLVSIRLAAVLVAVVTLTTFCETRKSLVFSVACRFAALCTAEPRQFIMFRVSRSHFSRFNKLFFTHQSSPRHSSQARLALPALEQGFLGLGGTPFSKTTRNI